MARVQKKYSRQIRQLARHTTAVQDGEGVEGVDQRKYDIKAVVASWQILRFLRLRQKEKL